MKIIIALDLATKTGFASNQPEISGVEDFSIRRGESTGMKYLRFTVWLKEMLEKIKPDLIVTEQAHHRGGAATEVAAGFQTHMQSTLAKWNLENLKQIEHTSYHTGTLKKHATGSGSAGKSDMMDAYERKWGSKPLDDNESDARWLLDLAKKEFCSP